MKNILIILMLLIYATKSISQQLTIDETVDYINNAFKKNSHPYTLELTSDGYLDLKYYYVYDLQNNPKVRESYRMHSSEINVTKETYPYLTLKIKCKNSAPCISNKGSSPKTYCLIFSEDNYLCDKLFNAFEYLLSEVSTSNQYNRQDDDPFAPQNFNRDNSILGKNTTQKISLYNHGGVYKVNVKISELPVSFILDSGASSVSISSTIEKKLINSGAVKKADYAQPALYKLADGSIVKCRRLFLKNIIIGNFTVKNVLACVGESNSPLLLGKSFLDSFSKWTIDNSTQELILEK